MSRALFWAGDDSWRGGITLASERQFVSFIEGSNGVDGASVLDVRGHHELPEDVAHLREAVRQARAFGRANRVRVRGSRVW